MDALATLWLLSIIGAVGFTATGFFLARSRMEGEEVRPVAALEPAAKPVVAVVDPDEPDEPQADAADEPAAVIPSEVTSLPPVALSTAPPATVAAAATSPSMAPRRDLRREEGDEDAPPSEDNVIDVLRNDSQAPKRASSLVPKRAASTIPPPVVAQAAMNSELERQLHALRVELRAEVVARDKIEMHARELAARLSLVSEQAVQRGRMSADGNGSLREPSPKGSSMVPKGSSIIPDAASDARTRLSTQAPGLFAEIDVLKADIARLTTENDSLRAATLGAAPPGPRVPALRTDLIVPEVLKRMVDRIARLENVRGAAVAETSGLVLAGSGELADALAAFGGYMRDAASRSERLLPLQNAEELTVRDSNGLVFSMRTLGRPEAELALVTLVLGEVPERQIRVIVAQTPGVEVDSLTAK